MRKKYESNFIAEFKRATRFYFPEDSYWYKIPDDRKFKKPFDTFFSTAGKFYALEFKAHVKTTAWPLNEVKEHQIKGLIKAARGGYVSWIFLNVRYGIGNGRKNFVRIITVKEYCEWIDKGIKSLTIKQLENQDCIYKQKIEEIGESLWPLNNLFL